MQAPSSICIFRLSAIGDVCNTVPLVRTLRSTWPSTKITWVIGKIEHSLIGDIALTDENIEFVVFDKSLGWQAYKNLKKQLKGQRFDVLLMLQAALRAGIASRFIKADIKLGFDKERAKDFQWLFSNQRIKPNPNKHVIDGFFDFLEAIGIKHRILDWQIPISEQALEFAQQTISDQPTFLISPCSSDRKNNFRNWSVENYAELCNYLISQGKQIILSGAPTERETSYAAAIAKLVNNDKLKNLSGKTSLKQLFALISEVDTVIAPDSGPIHMANATGTPCIGLYASSNTLRTGPYRYQHLVANKYPDAVQKFLGKDVSEVKWGQRVRNSEVMNLITLDDVVEKINLIS